MVSIENSFLPTYINLKVFTQGIFICWVFINAFLSWFLFYQGNPPMNRRTTMIPMTLFPPKIDSTTPLITTPPVPLTTNRRGDSWFLQNFLPNAASFFRHSYQLKIKEINYLPAPHITMYPLSISWIKWLCFIGNFCIIFKVNVIFYLVHFKEGSGR